MKIFIFIPAFIIFLFTLHKLVKDDYVFLRRNVKVEQVFDIAFILVLADLILGQLEYFSNSLYMTNIISGTVLGLFIFGKYKKLPLGRLYDFFSISFMATLPFIFLVNAIFAKRFLQIYYVIGALVYLFILLIFLKIFLKKLINRTIKEGYITICFLLIYFIFSLAYSLFSTFYLHINFINFENIYVLLLFLLTLIFLVKHKFINS